MPPDRPRQWRKQLFEILLKNVKHRVEGSQFEDGSINRQSWLAKFICYFFFDKLLKKNYLIDIINLKN